MKPIQVYLNEEEIKRLKKIAIDKGITLSALIRLYLGIRERVAASVENDFKYGDGSGRPANYMKVSKTVIKVPAQPTVTTIINEPEKILEKIKKTAVGSSNLCKQHGTPLDTRERCMIKGCKYA